MADELTFQDARLLLAKGLKERLDAHASKLELLRARELRKSAGRPLAKSDLCPLCGNLDTPATCTCLRKTETKKDEVAGYGGDASSGDSMAMSEMCKSCGKAGDLCKCATCKAELGKSDDKMLASLGKSEKCKTPGCDNEVGGASRQRLHPSSGYCPSCYSPDKHLGDWSDNALEARHSQTKDPRVAAEIQRRAKPVKKDEKSVANANKELKGFKSIATNLVAPIKTKPTMKAETMPRAKSVPEAPVAGAREPKAGKKIEAEGSGGQTKPSLKKNALAAIMGKGITQQSPLHGDKPHDPTAIHKLPLPGMTDPKVGGAHPETAAALAALKPVKAPKGVTGVPGKQPPGMGGGDAHKVAAVPPPIPPQARKSEVPATAKKPAVLPGTRRGKTLKVEPAPPTEGLSMLNHNRTLAGVR